MNHFPIFRPLRPMLVTTTSSQIIQSQLHSPAPQTSQPRTAVSQRCFSIGWLGTLHIGEHHILQPIALLFSSILIANKRLSTQVTALCSRVSYRHLKQTEWLATPYGGPRSPHHHSHVARPPVMPTKPNHIMREGGTCTRTPQKTASLWPIC